MIGRANEGTAGGVSEAHRHRFRFHLFELFRADVALYWPLSRQALNILAKIKTYSGDHELIFIGDHNPRKPMGENTVNKSLRVMGYDTQVEVCGHGFRTMACSSLNES